jgi:hypothetical protein
MSLRSSLASSSTLLTSGAFAISDSFANASLIHRGQPADCAGKIVVGPMGTIRTLSLIAIPPHISQSDWRPAMDCPDAR